MTDKRVAETAFSLRHYRWVFVLFGVNFILALCVVYTTHYSRTALSKIEALKQQEDQLYLSHKQLLIERGLRLNLSVLQKKAEKSLGMYLPKPAERTFIRQ